ncbi:MAG: sensor histidine kinase [Lachnospiraceae bacterium]
MYKKVRKKFIKVLMAAFLIIMFFLMLGLDLSYIYRLYKTFDTRFNIILASEQSISDDKRPDVTIYNMDLKYEIRYFTVTLDSSGNVTDVDVSRVSTADEQEAAELAMEWGTSSESYDRIIPYDEGYYCLRVIKTDTGWFNVWLEVTSLMESVHYMFIISFAAMIAIDLLIFIFLWLYSKKAVAPIMESMEKQKQFITNAGHELKTPLAVISANTEVLEMTYGENEWTQSTMHQVKRLSALVANLIQMARMEEDTDVVTLQDVQASEIVEDASSSFKTVAENQGKKLETDIEKDIVIHTDKAMYTEIANILLDNAVKYCDDGGCIRVKLGKDKKRACLSVSNDYKDGEGQDYSRFFERFYRADTAHNNNKKSGYGIGLSMARSIVGMLKGEIKVDYKDGRILFQVLL